MFLDASPLETGASVSQSRLRGLPGLGRSVESKRVLN